MEYMRDNLEDKYGILVLQNKILEIAVYRQFYPIDDYCLMGGSRSVKRTVVYSLG